MLFVAFCDGNDGETKRYENGNDNDLLNSINLA